jgi:HEAT repeat protein
MKWLMMLLIFIGGIYFLVNKREKEARQKAVTAEEQNRAAPEPTLPQMTPKVYAMSLSPETIITLRALTIDANEKVRFASLELLWQLQDEQTPTIIQRMFREETEPETKMKLINMLAKDKSKLSLALLGEALNDYDKETRVKAVEAISTFASREAITILTRSMQDYDEDIRFKSLEAINKIKNDIEAAKEKAIKEGSKRPDLLKVE